MRTIFSLICSAMILCGTLALSNETAAQTAARCEVASIDLKFAPIQGGAWTDSIAVTQGQEFVARINYDNQSTAAGINTSLVGILAAGFTLVSGSTRNCSTPSQNEQVCNTDPGQAGALREDQIWCNGQLTVSPTAGLYDVSPGQTSGVFEIGKKRYLNFLNCDYILTNGENTDDLYGFAPGNTIRKGLSCGAGGASFALRSEQSQFNPVDLMGRRYANFQNCDYQKVSPGTAFGNTDDLTGFAPSNRPIQIGCGASNSSQVIYRAANSSANPVDHLGKRYLNFSDCDYAQIQGWNTDDVTSFMPSNTPATTLRCGEGTNGVKLRSEQSKIDPLDLLDRTRGKGYIEFRVRASNLPGSYYHGVQIRGDNVTTREDFGEVRVGRRASCSFCS